MTQTTETLSPSPFADLAPETLQGLAIEAETALLRLPRDCADAAEVRATLDALECALSAEVDFFVA